MDLQRLGGAFRMARIRRGWRQVDVARRAGVSQPLISKIERGGLGQLTLRAIEEVAEVLEIRLDVRAHWRGSELDRLLSGHHSAMHEIATGVLRDFGWEIASEVSFNVYGERGVIDIVAWHAPTRTLLLVELKTELADVNNLLETTDRRRRLAAAIVKQRGWQPRRVAVWVLLAESRTNRRRLQAHRTVLRTAFPLDGRAVRGWLARPDRPFAALSFLSDIKDGSGRPSLRIVRRVRVRKSSTIST